LQVLTPHIDHARVVHLLKKNDAVALASEYLKSVQKENLTAVNEALNDLYISEEDHPSLKTSIDDFNNFDQMLLAQKIEKHELLEFRRIAAYIYKRNKNWNQSVALSKIDKMFKDAIDTAAESQDADIAEDLLRYFVETVGDKSCFSATLYTCYDLIRPDTAMELAWRHGYVDHVMPYMIQYMRHMHDKVKVLEERTAPPKVEEDNSAAVANSILGGVIGGGMMINDRLLIGDGSGYGSYNVGANNGIPDPYAQPNQGYGGDMGAYGAPAANAYGGYGANNMGNGMGMGGGYNGGASGSGW